MINTIQIETVQFNNFKIYSIPSIYIDQPLCLTYFTLCIFTKQNYFKQKQIL